MKYTSLRAWFKNIWAKASAALRRCRRYPRECPCEALTAAKRWEEHIRRRYDSRSEDYYALRDQFRALPVSPANIIGALTPIMTGTLSELRSRCRFDVRVSGEGDWEVVTDSCAIGGCDMEIIKHFPTERDALIFGSVLKAVGYKIDRHTACPECYAEYMMNCL